jgi:hypothetical protein
MISYSDFKREYVGTGIFYTPTGDYTGFVNVLSGVPYISNTDIKLLPTETYAANLLISNYLKDRTVDEEISLPYDESSVLFQPNDFLTKNLFNEKLLKLKDNNTFLYSRMFMAENSLPSSAVSYFGLSAANADSFRFYDTYSSTIPFYNSVLYGYLSGVRDCRFAVNLDNKDIFSIFAITNTEIITLTGNNYNLSIVEKSNKLESEENEVIFGELKNICRHDNFIFVTDYKSHLVYKYDIGGYYNNDSVLYNKRNYFESIGGLGTKRDKSRFNGPSQIGTDGKTLAVYDSNNYVIKIYDLALNYVNKITGIGFNRTPVAALEYSPHLDLLYILTYNTDGTLKLFIYDSICFTFIESYDVPVSIRQGEVVNNIEFSKSSSMFFYICTSEEVYKLLTNKPSSIVGRYSENKIFNNINATRTQTLSVFTNLGTNFWNNQIGITFRDASWKWEDGRTSVLTLSGTEVVSETSQQNDKYVSLRLHPTEYNYENALLFSQARVYTYSETNNFKCILKEQNIENYGSVDISIVDDDYIQTTTINKELYKVISDIFSLKNNILGRFSGKYDYSGILTLEDYNYNIDFKEFILNDLENYYIGDNEKGILGVINRCIVNIYNLQKQLLSLTQVDKSDILPVFNNASSPYNNVYVL